MNKDVLLEMLRNKKEAIRELAIKNEDLYKLSMRNYRKAAYSAEEIDYQFETENTKIRAQANELREKTEKAAIYLLGLISTSLLVDITFSLQMIAVASVATIAYIELKRLIIIKNFETHKGSKLSQERNKAIEKSEREANKVMHISSIEDDLKKQLVSINKAISLVISNASDNTLLQNKVIRNIARKEIDSKFKNIQDKTNETGEKKHIKVPLNKN